MFIGLFSSQGGYLDMVRRFHGDSSLWDLWSNKDAHFMAQLNSIIEPPLSAEKN